MLGTACAEVAISGYVMRPPQARREKPRVSAFTSANIDKALAVQWDLVLTFSALQAGIAADLSDRFGGGTNGGFATHPGDHRAGDGRQPWGMSSGSRR